MADNPTDTTHINSQADSIRSEPVNAPTMAQAFFVWLKIGLLSFGGPAAQIALMHKIVVAEKNWLSEKQYLSALSFCMLLPGPEAMQLATFAGWKLHGVRGGIIAGLLFVIPGALVVFFFAAIYSLYGKVSLVESLFLGIKAAVIIVVIEALLRVAKKALTNMEHWVIAAAAFVMIFFFNFPFPLIIASAALYGFLRSKNHNTVSENIAAPAAGHVRATVTTIAIWLALWLLPFIFLWAVGAHDLLLRVGAFFSQLAVVTFGGAYAVLAYLAQDVVSQYGWLSAGEMMDGLGLAETTPGPLILVTEFVAFLAGFKEGGFALATSAALITLWVTFVPCFLWIFAGAPYIDWLSDQPRLRGAMSAITAAVVGVILNLSVWFALHVLFRQVEPIKQGILTLWTPSLSSLDWRVALLTVLCGIAAFVYHRSIGIILLMSALAALALSVF